MPCSRCGKNKPNVTPDPAQSAKGQVYHPAAQPSNVTAASSAAAVKDAIQGLKYAPSGKK